MNWTELAEQVLTGHAVTRQQALAMVQAPDEELLAILHAAYRIRAHYHGHKVRVHVLQNAKSGACPEDCAFCSQSSRYDAEIERYPLQAVAELVAGAQRAHAMGAFIYCMVTATRGPSALDLETICEATRQIKANYPLKICTSLGLLRPGQAEQLRAAGVDRYNHNLETSSRYFPQIVSSHSFEQRLETVRRAKAAGLEACCGGILGLGEQPEDWVDLALSLRELRVDSVPINFLNPRPGTPLGERPPLRPQACLKGLAMFRFVHPAQDVRVAGGREVVLGQLQPLALYAANSLFTNGYLTTAGQGDSADAQMIRQAGFEAEVVAT